MEAARGEHCTNVWRVDEQLPRGAGQAGFAIGSDTGGSVRVPAALREVKGFKPSPGLWATEGVFPLAPMLDTIRLPRSPAHETAVIPGTLTGDASRPPGGPKLRGPVNHFLDELDAEALRAAVRAE